MHHFTERLNSSRVSRWARGTALVFIFGLQLWGIVRSWTAIDRYFCWAPYDAYTEYAVQVRGSEGWLRADEIARRYRIPISGRDNRSPEHIIQVFRQYESTYGLADPALELRLSYRVNGGSEQTWSWPEKH